MKRPTRLFTLAMFATGAAVACGAAYGEEDDDSPLPTPPTVDAGTDAAPDADIDVEVVMDAAPIEDVPTIPGAKCVAASCLAVGGKCVEDVCRIDCGSTGGCGNKIVNCPSDSDCQVVCNNGNCYQAQCTGGRSCTFECVGQKSCEAVACSANDCTIRCSNKDTCRQNIKCGGGKCAIECTGELSCRDGVSVNAGSSCAIACTGYSACSGYQTVVNCGASPDASIVCGPGQYACKDGLPTCRNNARCEIACTGPNSCGRDVCCEAGICNVQAGTTGATNTACK